MKLKLQVFFLICVLGLLIGCDRSDASGEAKKSIKGIVSLWKRQKLKKVDVDVPPTANRQVPLPDQWTDDSGTFALVVFEDAHLVSAPVDRPVVLYDFSISERVTALFEAPVRTTSDREEGPWVYVSHRDHPQGGWVRKSMLGFVSDFRPISWSNASFAYVKGQMENKFHVKPNGRYVATWAASGGGLSLKGMYYGQLYGFEDIIWAKKDKAEYYEDFFWVDHSEALHLEWRYRNDTLTRDVPKGE